MTGRRSSRVAVSVLAAILLANTALLIAAWWERPELPAQLTESSDGERVSVRPQPTTVTGSVSTLLDVVLSDPITLVAPAWSGVVTAVHVQRGATVRSGDPLAAVDGVDVMLLATDQPFFRRLGEGSTGRDVLQLEEVFEELGFEVGEADGYFDSVLGAAVREFNGDRGSDGIEFDPAAAVWLPAETVTLATIEFAPGMVAPSQGQTLASTVPSVRSATLTDPSVMSSASQEYVIHIQEQVLPVNGDGQVDQGTDDELATFLAELNEQSQLEVTLSFSEPVTGFAVPGSAIIPAGVGYCVVTLPATDRSVPVRAELVESTLGRTIVKAALSPDIPVWANPDRDTEC